MSLFITVPSEKKIELVTFEIHNINIALNECGLCLPDHY